MNAPFVGYSLSKLFCSTNFLWFSRHLDELMYEGSSKSVEPSVGDGVTCYNYSSSVKDTSESVNHRDTRLFCDHFLCRCVTVFVKINNI